MVVGAGCECGYAYRWQSGHGHGCGHGFDVWVLVLFNSSKLKFKLLDCGLASLWGGVSLHTLVRTLARLLLLPFLPELSLLLPQV